MSEQQDTGAMQRRIEALETQIREVWGYARRYCDARSTYATSQYNAATRVLIGLGVLPRRNPPVGAGRQFWPDGTPWARDGMGPTLGAISVAEHAEGVPLEAWQQRVATEERDAIAARFSADVDTMESLRRSIETCGGIVGFQVDGEIIWQEAPKTGWEAAQVWKREAAREEALLAARVATLVAGQVAGEGDDDATDGR